MDTDFNTTESNEPIPNIPSPDIDRVQSIIEQCIEECSKVIVGQRQLIELVISSILSDGHILLEGVPGIAKTLTARVISKTIDTNFARIQFTPDLMPADIIGTSIYNMNNSKFEFKKGPIFSNVVLIDEINRAPAKTQSALFEVMEERQITYDGIQYNMEKPFIIIATQNPLEQEGTYALPEAQLDRFLMKINIDYPSPQEELEILTRYKTVDSKDTLDQVNKILDVQELQEIKQILKTIHVEDQILKYITDIIIETRENSAIYLGASPRASLAMLKASRVKAVISGRDFITPDDIQFVAPHILNHRIILTPDAEMEGVTSMSLIEDILSSLEVPR